MLVYLHSDMRQLDFGCDLGSYTRVLLQFSVSRQLNVDFETRSLVKLHHVLGSLRWLREDPEKQPSVDLVLWRKV